MISVSRSIKWAQKPKSEKRDINLHSAIFNPIFWRFLCNNAILQNQVQHIIHLFYASSVPILFNHAYSLLILSTSWWLVSGTSITQEFRPQSIKASPCSVSTKTIKLSMQESSLGSRLARTSQRPARFKWSAISLTVPSVQCKWLTTLTLLTS